MQRVLPALLLFLFTAPMWAQSQIPGTFNRTQPLPNNGFYAVPIITTPQISFGSGLTPPVVVTGQSLVVSSPHVEYEPSLLSEPSSTQQPMESYTGKVKAPKLVPFDFVVAPTEGVKLGEAGEGPSLGEEAAAMRKGPPPTKRTFTNEDINKMNQSSGENMTTPNSNAPQEQPQAEPSKPPKNETEQQKPHSPFAPALMAEE